MNMKYCFALITAVIYSTFVYSAYAADNEKGSSSVYINNNTDYAFTVKFSDKSNKNPASGPGAYVGKRAKGVEVKAVRPNENLAIDGSKFWIQIDAPTISEKAPHKIMEGVFNWGSQAGRTVGHTFILKKDSATGMGIPGKEEIGVGIKYAVEGGKTVITLDKE